MELKEGQAVVRVIKEQVSDEDILKLAFASNVGRESTMGEKALSNLSLYKERIKSLPAHIDSQDVEELKSLVAKHIDTQNKGLDTFNTNLALLSNLAKNTENTDIIGALDSIKGDSQMRVKIINMFVDNAGSFHNLTHSGIFKDLELREHLANAIGFVGRAEESRASDFAYLNREIDGFLKLSDEGRENALTLDSNRINNLTAQALGLSLAKFSRQENPSSVLYEVLKTAPKELEKLTQPTLFGEGKALSEVNIYDFIEYLISTGAPSSESSNLIKNLHALEEYAKANPNQVKSLKPNTNTNTEPTSQELRESTHAQDFEQAKELWLKTFNLKSIDEDFIVEIPQEISQKIGKQIKLNLNDLTKIIQNNRAKYIPEIKETFSRPQVIFIDEKGDLIFAKTLKEKIFFVNVNRDYGENFKGLSLAPKKEANLINKLEHAKEVIYNTLAHKLRDSTAQQAFTDVPLANKANRDILPQNAQILATEKKEREILEGFKKGANPKSFKEYEAKIQEIEQRREYLENAIDNQKPFFQKAQKELKELVGDFIKVTQESHNPIKYKRNFSKRVKSGEISLADKESFEFWRNNFLKDDVNASIWKSNLFKNLKDLDKQNAIKEFFIKKGKELEEFKANKEDLKKELKGIDRKLVLLRKAYNKRFEAALEAKNLLTSKGLLDSDFIKAYKRYYDDPNKEVLQTRREEIQELLNINPNKEFGTNYAEYYHDGKNTLEKLLAEAEDFKTRGEKGEFKWQVQGAFYKKELEELSGSGDISLVWGDSSFGLKHILDKHEGEFKNIAEELSEIVQKGALEKGQDNKYTIKTLEHTLVLGSKDNGEFVITAYKDRRNKKLGNHQTVVSGDFTDEPLGSSPLPPNLNTTLPLFEQPKPKTTREILDEAKEQGLSGKETLAKIKENKELKAHAQDFEQAKELWLKTFNLKSIDEDFTPNFSARVKESLSSVLRAKEIRLGKGSFVKLYQRDRLEFLPFIKETLENPNMIVRQVDGALIFAKDFNDKKFFTSIARDYNNAWIIVSNAPKSENGLRNKIKEGGSVLYGELPEPPIIAKPELTDKALNIEANSKPILP